LRPTQDIRAVILPLVQRQFGLGAAAMQSVLPGATASLDPVWRA
jgi:uncharacterized protein (DUF1501 family)